MTIAKSVLIAACVSIPLAGCVALAPGADKVRVTKNTADVSACTAMGNIAVPRKPEGQVDMGNADTQFHNAAVGLQANAAFVTFGTVGVPIEGIAYRCP